MTLGEAAQMVVVLAALHRAPGAVIGLGIAGVYVLQRLRRRLDDEGRAI